MAETVVGREKQEAVARTEQMLRDARDLIARALPEDPRATDGALLGAVLNALIWNYQNFRSK